jgi:hypothetical protein
LETNSNLKDKLTQVKELLGCQEVENDEDIALPELDFA